MNSPTIQSAINRWGALNLRGPRVGICRVRHDKECSVSRDKSGQRPAYLSRFYTVGKPVYGLPESVRINGGKSTVLLAPQWRLFEQEHAGIGPREPSSLEDEATNMAAFNYISRRQSGWVNFGPWPTVEQITWGGAYVVVYGIQGHKCFIQSYHNDKRPGDYVNIDYLQAFSTVFSDDRVAPEPTVFTFPIANATDAPLWMYDYDLTWVRAV